MKNEVKTSGTAPYKYRPVLFFALAYLFTWIFWIPAIFMSDNLGAVLMLIGLLAPAVVTTVFVIASGSDLLRKEFESATSSLPMTQV